MTDQVEVRVPSTVRPARSRSWHRVVGALLVAATLGVGLWFLTPSTLGGSTTYLATQGTSMLPTHEPGTLVVTRPQDEYAVGDVIAFHRDDPDYIVMHRIVAVDGDRFVTRGDNNASDDAFHPAVSDVVGRPWIVVPHGADVMTRLRSPLSVGVVFGVLAAFAHSAASRRPRSG